MKISLKMLFFDKIILVLSFFIILALIFTIITSFLVRNLDIKNNILKTQLLEIQSIANDIIQIKDIVESKEKKIGLRKTKGVVSTLEQMLKTLGINAKTIKPLEKKKVNIFIEDNAELELQDTGLNSIVNLLYKIENSPLPMKIKNIAIKTSFEDPDKFTLKLTISLLSKA